MPCFDKKLEASRSDFYMDKAETREVDCVITSGTFAYLYFEVCERKCLAYSHLYLSPLLTGEVQRMLEEKNVSLSNVEPAPLDALWALQLSFLSCCVNQGKLKLIHDFICMHMLEQV